MKTSHRRNELHTSSYKPYLKANKGLIGLLIMSFMTTFAVADQTSTAEHKSLMDVPVEDAVAKFKDISQSHPENQVDRLNYLKERDRAVNLLLLNAFRSLGNGENEAAEGFYQRILTIEPENAQAKLGLEEVERIRKHANAMSSARDAMDKADFTAAQNALSPILMENPKDTEAQNLSQEIDATRYTGGSYSQAPELGLAFKKPVSLQFKDANLKMIFEAISKTSGLNILFDKEIKSDLKATIFVKQATVEDTINLVLMQNQLEKKVLNENTLYIYPATSAKLKEHQDLVIRTFQLTNADAKQMQVLLKTVLKTKDLFVNEKTNSIVMRDTPDAVALAAKLIAAQDLNEPEVMLEMEVLEVSRSVATELGLKYPDQVSFTLGDQIQTLRDYGGINRDKIFVTPNLGLTLNLKKQDGDVDTLANPRIRVRQHEKAKIHIGERFPIITNTVTPSTGTPVVTGSIQYIDLGLKLEVEPDIHMDGEVGIKTSLEVSSLGAAVTNGIGADQTTAYRVNTRVANTALRLKDGETQILAGLISNEDRNNATKVPGLGDVPILGRLFSSHKHDKNKTELILAITPHIVRNIHQPDAEMAAYWSGTDSNIRSRPITAGKMDTIKMESRGASPVSETVATPIQVPPALPVAKPIAPLGNNENSGNQVKAYSAPAEPTKYSTQPVSTQPVITQTAPVVPRVMPRGPFSACSAGMSDAVVDPAAQK